MVMADSKKFLCMGIVPSLEMTRSQPWFLPEGLVSQSHSNNFPMTKCACHPALGQFFSMTRCFRHPHLGQWCPSPRSIGFIKWENIKGLAWYHQNYIEKIKAQPPIRQDFLIFVFSNFQIFIVIMSMKSYTCFIFTTVNYIKFKFSGFLKISHYIMNHRRCTKPSPNFS